MAHARTSGSSSMRRIAGDKMERSGPRDGEVDGKTERMHAGDSLTIDL